MFMLPVLIISAISIGITSSFISDALDRSGEETVKAVSNNVNLSLSNILQQNSQFANNPYMILSLKRILANGDHIMYSDAINIRSINASLKSIMSTYQYVSSVYLYLDGYESYYTSSQRIEKINDSDIWWQEYQNMAEDEDTMAVVLDDNKNKPDSRYLTLYQRMPLYSGVVVMTIDLDEYGSMLDSLTTNTRGTIVFANLSHQLLFCRGQNSEDAANIDISDIAEDGRWMRINGNNYLVHQTINDNYNIQIVYIIPAVMLLNNMMAYIPLMLLIIAAGIISAMASAYVTTKRNFNYINYIVMVLADAENGRYPEITESEKANDEYDLILNNIIRLHLKTEKLNNELEQKRHAEEVASLTALQAQINPHFMFNTLQMIQIEAVKGGQQAEGVIQMTSDLADIMKYALSDPLCPITLNEEIAYLKKYVAIQKRRFGDRFIIYYEVEEQMYEFPVFRLMLQPIIENAILHGVRYKDERGYIKLVIFRRNGNIMFRVFDSGVGMSRERLKQVRESIGSFNIHNIGLSNVNNRLKLYYGEQSALTIISAKGEGTIVKFSIPEDKIQIQATKS